MIDHNLFTAERLVNELLRTAFGNINKWWALVEIVPDYMPPFPDEKRLPSCVVRCKVPNSERYHFLRYSQGPGQGHTWDIYGDDYLTPELALLALVQAPIPPEFIDKEVWKAACQEEQLSGHRR